MRVLELLALSRNVILVHLTKVTLKWLKRRAGGNKVVLDDLCVVRGTRFNGRLEGVRASQDSLLMRAVN